MNFLDLILMGMCINQTCLTNTSNTRLVGSFYQRRLVLSNLKNELKGRHLRIATVQNGALSYAVKEKGTWVGKGVAFDLLNILQEKYKFNYSVILAEENSASTNQLEVFKMLYKGQADLGAAFLPITSFYWKYAEFSTTLDVGEWVILLKRPPASASGSGLTAPFTLNVWLLILVSFLVVAPIMALIMSAPTKICPEKEVKPITLLECLWFVYSALLKQGTTLIPISDSSRLIFATWWVFITLLTAFYTANLTAFLTLSEFTLPIRKPYDIKVKNFPWVAAAGNVIQEASSEHMESLYKILNGSKGRFVTDDGPEILKKWVSERNYLYIAEKPNVDILLYQDYLNKTHIGFSERKKCTYVITKWAIFKRPRAFVYSKGFRFGPLFNSVLRSLFEAGLAKHFLNYKLPHAHICPLNLRNKERQLRNADLLLTYYITGVGFAISTIIFILENVFPFIGRIKGITTSKSSVFKWQKQVSTKRLPQNVLVFNYNVYNYNLKGKNINGRDYWLAKSEKEGKPFFIPVRSASALLFQQQRIQ